MAKIIKLSFIDVSFFVAAIFSGILKPIFVCMKYGQFERGGNHKEGGEEPKGIGEA